jgi:hypothetical protein
VRAEAPPSTKKKEKKGGASIGEKKKKERGALVKKGFTNVPSLFSPGPRTKRSKA